MTPIRPNPSAVPQPVRSADAARAAQRAFFEAALGKAALGKAAASTAEPTAKPLTVKITPTQTDAPAPQRILRPGSLVDIKV